MLRVRGCRQDECNYGATVCMLRQDGEHACAGEGGRGVPLSKALIDLIESQEDLTIVDRIHIMQNTTLRLIYKNTLEYLDYKERQVKKQMCEDLK